MTMDVPKGGHIFRPNDIIVRTITYNNMPDRVAVGYVRNPTPKFDASPESDVSYMRVFLFEGGHLVPKVVRRSRCEYIGTLDELDLT